MADAAIRKRQQISKSNRTMFMWVAIASAVIGLAAVLGIFLVQKMLFNERVLAKKQETISTLNDNLENIEELKNQVRSINTNQALLDTRAKEGDQPLQVILDALPADANSSALGASLQEKLLDAPNITTESLVVDPVGDEVALEGEDGDAQADTEDGETDMNAISFTFTVSAPSSEVNSLQQLLVRLERSIRAINVTNVSVEIQGSRIVMTANAQAYYEPAKDASLTKETVR